MSHRNMQEREREGGREREREREGGRERERACDGHKCHFAGDI